MKKVISILSAILMTTALSVAYAEENPKVFVNGSEIIFADQQAIIKDDRTLVPVRGVLNAMGAKVQWFGEEQRVQIDSADNFTRAFLTIGDASIRYYKFKDVFSAERFYKEIDVAPQVINDRTMIPLRAIFEAFDCKVEWDAENMTVNIETKDGAPAFDEDTENTYVYLSTDATDVNTGDEFDVYVNIKNFPENAIISHGSIGLIYDKSEFKYKSCTLYDGKDEISSVIGTNPDFAENILLTGFARTEFESLNADGVYMKFTMKALTDNGGKIALSKNFETERGYNTTLGFRKLEKVENFDCNPLNMGIDTTGITVK